MSLRSRVTPTNQIITTSGRGLLMGNRGCLHDAQQNILRQFALRRWIICHIQFRGRKRQLMSPGQYTELFFLDEATALAAGHRPCAECRRDAYKRFKRAWIEGNPDHGLSANASITEIDEHLHRDRLTESGQQRTHARELAGLPDGVFVRLTDGDDAFLWFQGKLHRWARDMRYTRGPEAVPEQQEMRVSQHEQLVLPSSATRWNL